MNLNLNKMSLELNLRPFTVSTNRRVCLLMYHVSQFRVVHEETKAGSSFH